MPLSKQRKKKICNNCGNGIAENGGKKMWFRNLGRVKKKVLRSQYFHNKSHMISYYQFKKNCDKLIMAMALPKQGEKKIVRT